MQLDIALIGQKVNLFWNIILARLHLSSTSRYKVYMGLILRGITLLKPLIFFFFFHDGLNPKPKIDLFCRIELHKWMFASFGSVPLTSISSSALANIIISAFFFENSPFNTFRSYVVFIFWKWSEVKEIGMTPFWSLLIHALMQLVLNLYKTLASRQTSERCKFLAWMECENLCPFTGNLCNIMNDLCFGICFDPSMVKVLSKCRGIK